jgi:hypothetical protein
MATGVWPDKHGVRDNSFTGADYGAHPDFLTLLKQTDPALSTFAALDWPPLAEQGTFGPAIDLLLVADGEEHGYYTEDARIAGAATAVLRHQDPDATFIYLGCVDMVGHGCGALSTEYTEAIGRVDGWVGDLTDAVASRPGYADERWLILVTTDHGHLDEGGHGGYTDTERRTFILAIGTDVSPGLHLDGRLVDVAATVLHHFGLEIPVRLDGRSLLPGSLPRQQAAR